VPVAALLDPAHPLASHRRAPDHPNPVRLLQDVGALGDRLHGQRNPARVEKVPVPLEAAAAPQVVQQGRRFGQGRYWHRAWPVDRYVFREDHRDADRARDRHGCSLVPKHRWRFPVRGQAGRPFGRPVDSLRGGP
jgi:hypothetical protein